MAITLYDISVPNYLQTLGAVAGFLDKSAAHCREKNIDLNEVLEWKLHPDMFPFRLQVLLVIHHAIGAIEGLKKGEFSFPSERISPDFAGLQKLLTDTQKALQTLKRDEINALEGGDVFFTFGGAKVPFLAENFVLTFSLPNFYFHATTAYDILRSKGFPLGKRDFLGQLRFKQ